MLDDIRKELQRLDAHEIGVRYDDKFEPEAGALLLVHSGDAYWHLLPEQFLAILQQLPSGGGSGAVHQAIESHGPTVWHGPAPEESRETLH